MASVRAASTTATGAGAGGVLALKSPATVTTGNLAGPIAVSPNGKSVYIGNAGDDTISQFSVDAGGKLSVKSPATVPAGDFPADLSAPHRSHLR